MFSLYICNFGSAFNCQRSPLTSLAVFMDEPAYQVFCELRIDYEHDDRIPNRMTSWCHWGKHIACGGGPFSPQSHSSLLWPFSRIRHRENSFKSPIVTMYLCVTFSFRGDDASCLCAKHGPFSSKHVTSSYLYVSEGLSSGPGTASGTS